MNKQASNTSKIIKAFIVSFVSLIVLILIAAVFFPKTYEVSRSIEIKAPTRKIFPLVADFSKWNQWSPWFEVEPSAQFIQEGTSGKTGSTFEWNGKIIGKGRMTLTEIQDLHKLTMHLKFEKPRGMESNSEFLFESKTETTLVTWTDRGNLSYPMGRIFKKYINQMIGRDFEQGLTKLKASAEKP